VSDIRLGMRVRSDIPPLYKAGMRSQLYAGHELRMVQKAARFFWGLPLDLDLPRSILDELSETQDDLSVRPDDWHS